MGSKKKEQGRFSMNESNTGFIAQLVYITALIIRIFTSLSALQMYGLSCIHMHRIKGSSQDEPALDLGIC